MVSKRGNFKAHNDHSETKCTWSKYCYYVSTSKWETFFFFANLNLSHVRTHTCTQNERMGLIKRQYDEITACK